MRRLILLFLVAASTYGAPTKTPYKICVPMVQYEFCQKMAAEVKSNGVDISCVPARDRIECMSKLKDHTADFEVIDPEDLYVAAGLYPDSDLAVFKEIRTKNEPEAEFRYEAVVVVPNDLPVKTINDLKGMKSCHTGVGRNVGYKIPITKLSAMGILPPMNDAKLSPRESELKALSTFFSKSCVVGAWSPSAETNRRLKTTYSNLCALCEHPDVCDYPDANSGYEGALRCLTKAGGQVAFTKVEFVKKFFGMAYGQEKAKSTGNDPSRYSYLCPDATKKPLSGPPCTWAARPWQGYMGTSPNNDFAPIKDLISKLKSVGDSKKADWLLKVLNLNEDAVLADSQKAYKPKEYLEKAKYWDVIERDVLKPRRVVRLCVVDDTEQAKCEMFEKAVFSRDIRPSIGCVKKTSARECMKAVNEKQADAVVLDPQDVIKAEKDFNLMPILAEQYNNQSKQLLVAVVKKGSSFKTINDLKGKKACTVSNDKAGFAATMQYLLDSKLLQKNTCPYEQSIKEFFGGVQQAPDPVECMIFGQGEVAFAPYSSLHKVKNEVEVICPSKKTVEPIAEVTECGLITLPPKMVMVSKNLPEVQREEIVHTALSASEMFTNHPEYFLMFGSFKGKANVIFSNHANGLAPAEKALPVLEGYKKIIKNLATCTA